MHGEKQTDYQRRIIALSPDLKTFIDRRIQNHHDAQDLHQNTLMKLCESEKKFDDRKGSLRGFAFTICHREIVDFFRARGRSHLVFPGDISEYGAVCEDTKCTRLESENIFRLLDEEKRIDFLRYHAGKTERTSTERNKARRTFQELRRKVARLESEGFDR